MEVCKIKTLDLVLQGSRKNMGSDKVLLAFLRYDVVGEDKKNIQGPHFKILFEGGRDCAAAIQHHPNSEGNH